MVDIIKLEWKKLISRKDIMLILGVLILSPFLFSFCIVQKVAGLNFGGQVSADIYGIMIWSFFKYLFVLYLVPIYIASSMLEKEVENRSIQIMLANKKRMSVIRAKLLTYLAVLTGFFVLFQLSSFVSYQLLIKGTEYGIASTTPFMENAFLYLFQWFEQVFVLMLSIALCCVIKGNAVLVCGLLTVILEKVIANVEGISRILPYHISDYNAYGAIKADQLLSANLLSVGIYIIIFGVLGVIISGIWKKRDF